MKHVPILIGIPVMLYLSGTLANASFDVVQWTEPSRHAIAFLIPILQGAYLFLRYLDSEL